MLRAFTTPDSGLAVSNGLKQDSIVIFEESPEFLTLGKPGKMRKKWFLVLSFTFNMKVK